MRRKGFFLISMYMMLGISYDVAMLPVLARLTAKAIATILGWHCPCSLIISELLRCAKCMPSSPL